MQDEVMLDLAGVQDRLELYNSVSSLRALDGCYEFRADLGTRQNLDLLAQFAIHPANTAGCVFLYKPVMLEIIATWTSKPEKDAVEVFDALGRIITLYPIAVPLVEAFMACRGEHLFAILQNPSTQGEDRLRKILLSLHRLMFENASVFTKYIRPAILYGLLENGTPLLQYLAIRILAVYVGMGEKALLHTLQAHIADSTVLGDYEGDPNIDYKYLDVNEANRFSNFSRLPLVPETFDKTNAIVITQQDMSDMVVSIAGIMVPNVHKKSGSSGLKTTFVPTAKSVAVIRQLAQTLQRAQPMMLIGPSGSGKTFLINELSRYMGSQDSIVKIHLGEQTDAKLLVGTYTSGAKLGTFEWRSGVLTTAVSEGRWVLVEDIDKAPTEVLSILLTLLEKRELAIPSRGETIKAANGFQLISTVTTTEKDKRNSRDDKYIPNIIGMRIWKTIYLEEPTVDDIHEILTTRYPILIHLLPKLIQTYTKVCAIYNDPRFISLNRGSHARHISLRDLMKLCSRLDTLFTSNGIENADQLIETSLYDSIFAETVDCFAGAIGEYRALRPVIDSIGASLEVPPSRVDMFLTRHTPSFESNDSILRIGRATLRKYALRAQKKTPNSTSFASTNHSLKLMERIAVSVRMIEPILLVGETGTGKTTVVQQVAKLLHKPLTVINVSQQTESGDLLGGYKPVNSKTIAIPIQEEFESLFVSTFSLKKNERFYKILHKCFNKGQWKNVLRLWKEAYKMAVKHLKVEDKVVDVENMKKKRKLNLEESNELLKKWTTFHQMTLNFEKRSSAIENSFIFDFVEGALVKAVKNGEWLLLDEINLASADTLESISDLLSDSMSRAIILSEKGDAEPVRAHPDFRIFACMNPATDVGKKDLPSGIRSRFTEIYVHSPDQDITDLLLIIDKYIKNFSSSDEWVGNDIAELYIEAKKLAEQNMIVDGSGQKPHFSIRTLTRTLLYVRDIVSIYGLRRSLYDGFCMSFLTLLDQKSEKLLLPIIEKHTIGKLKNMKSVMSQAPPSPGPDYVQFNHYWMPKGSFEITGQNDYIITPFVEKNLMNLVRATSGKRFPVLVQGPTSAGKTSMIKYLADITGHKFVRINNHEHTDLQEYLGTYLTDDSGRLSFKEGILVEALRNGYWIVLDELNLAPTDVLEALNRLLDDNRELFIPETQEVVHPHPQFMLFATQNPPGIYGGRKVLSRAFRNRFLELHFDDIPQEELETILRERCKIAPSYAKKIVEVYRQLTIHRSASKVFEQKNSFATLRDLFRWAMRDAVGYEELAANGYMLLAERCRTKEEKSVIKDILEKVMKVKLDMDTYYESLEDAGILNSNSSIVWTKALRRLAVLLSTCLKNNEPVLLVGETGCGKTTVCQLLAKYLGKKLIVLNAHQNTETGDILGAQRPVRNRSAIQQQLSYALLKALGYDSDTTDYSLDDLLAKYGAIEKTSIPEELVQEIKALQNSLRILFEWCDGPLIQALKEGQFFLLDEISLADDSVLERLNSVLEPERSLLLAEKGSLDSFVVAQEGFQFFATMNPGGDYGKKELSPALRNRFTEIWVPSMESFDDVELLVASKLTAGLDDLTRPIVAFSEWYAGYFGQGNASSGIISLRDILAWIDFVNKTFQKVKDKYACLAHGALMVFIDALGTNNTSYLAEDESGLQKLKLQCMERLSTFAGVDLTKYIVSDFTISMKENELNVGVFSLQAFKHKETSGDFNFEAPTTRRNLMRVARAMQVSKPILLEGSPGVGKTSLITALASTLGKELTRINLSEQTDLMDLFGSDSPGEKTGEFVWHDAPFLRAMQRGDWVLLDEMNLASQSVLEGLNACLDHRGEAYIPELDRSFKCHPDFLVFAAQNPQSQGGGRKGLPKSFVNRFSVVYIDLLTKDDLILITQHLYPDIDRNISGKMIELMSTIEDQVCKKKLWGMNGSPWEFNLRDTLRWLGLINKASLSRTKDPLDFIELVVKQRYRTESDIEKAQGLIDEIFGAKEPQPNFYLLGEDFLQVNAEIAPRPLLHEGFPGGRLIPLQCNLSAYESALHCINNNWPLLIVGPSNSGKTDLVQFLASVIGKRVSVFSMNSDVDSMDILGGYEQLDITRKISKICGELSSALKSVLLANITTEKRQGNAMCKTLELLDLISQRTITRNDYALLCSGFNSVYSYLTEDAQLQHISSKLKDLEALLEGELPVTFEWFDGMLVDAVQNGHWLILDNANLCPSSVLDRLNSLLETKGSLIINECSQADGSARVLKPHPDFRLFLTINPKYGELSRAMRNRCVELYLQALPERATAVDKECLQFGVCVDSSEIGPSTEILPAIPLKAFIPSTLSYQTSYGELLDISKYSEDKISLGLQASLLPINKVQDIGTWARNTMRLKDVHVRNWGQRLDRLTNALIELSIPERLYTMYVESFADIVVRGQHYQNSVPSQKLLPVLNNRLVPVLQERFPALTTSESVYMFDGVAQLEYLEYSLNTIKRKSLTAKVTDLSYIELSAAVFSGRNVKNAPRVPIFQVLQGICKYVKKNVSAAFFNQVGFYYSLWNLLTIAICAFKGSKKKDEARLRIYRELLQEWLVLNKEKGLDVQPLIDIIALFDGAHLLSRGHSMSLLWENYKGVYPSTVEGWNTFSSLMKLANKFDEVCHLQYYETYDVIRDVYKMFNMLRKDVLDGELSMLLELYEQISAKIQTLIEYSSKFLVQRHHHFMNEFDALLLLYVLGNHKEDDTMAQLFPLTSLSTEILAKVQSKKSPYPAVFNLLWHKTNGIYATKISYLFTERLFEDIIYKANAVKDVPGSQMRQLLADGTSLLAKLITIAPDILQNQHSYFAKILEVWINEVVDIHEAYSKQPVVGSTSENAATVEHFRYVFVTYLEPALQLSKSFNSLKDLGIAWIYFSVGLLLLYVPDRPCDPAIRDYVLHDTAKKHQFFSTRLVSSLKLIQNSVSGDTLKAPLLEVDTRKVAYTPTTYRPETSIDELFEEWTAFFESTVSAKNAESLLEGFLSSTNNMTDRYEMFQQNTSHFLSRLSTRYTYFADVNDIFAGYVFAMKFGFDLLKQEQDTVKASDELLPMWFSDPLTISSAKCIENSRSKVFGIIKNWAIDNLGAEHVLCHLLSIFGLHKMETSLLPYFEDILRSLHYRWSARRLKDEKEAESQSNTFKYTDTVDDYEDDMKRMFPDYSDGLSFENATDKNKNVDTSEVYFNIAKAYIDIFEDGDSHGIQELVKSGHEITSSLLKTQPQRTSNGMQPSYMLSVLDSLSGSLSLFAEETLKDKFDFYGGAAFSESQKAISIVDSLWRAVHNLLGQWPEHSTLQELSSICSEYLQFPVSTPIAKQLQKIEQLYTYACEWEKYAAAHVSLDKHIKSLIDVIVSWRRLELKTWNELFTFEDEKLLRNIGKWWFYLYETIIISNLQGEKDINEIDQTSLLLSLNTFFSKSSYGDFDARLSLVDSFCKHLKLLALNGSNLYHAIQNSLTYYKQFQTTIQNHIAKEKKVLEKEMSEIILLASWKDVNIDALKQSSRRSHNSLYKIVRKYRSLINNSVQSVVESGLPAGATQTKLVVRIDTELPFDFDIGAVKSIVEEVPGWKTRPDVLKNVDQVSRKMNSFAREIESKEYPSLAGLSKEYLKEADRLRDSTPKVYSKKVKKLLASLRLQKAKLFSDATKELKRAGLKTSFREDIHKMQVSSTYILANNVSLAQTVVSGSDSFFFRLVDLLPHLRNSVAAPAEDAPLVEVEKGMAIIENLVYYLMVIRSKFYAFTQDYEKLKLIYTDVKAVALVEGDINHSCDIGSIESLRYICKWLPLVIDYAVSTTDIMESIVDVIQDKKFLQSTKERLQQYALKLEDLKICDEIFMKLALETQQYIDSIMFQFSTRKKSTNFFVYDTLLSWMVNNQSSTSKSETSSCEVQEVDQIFRKIFTTILISFQELVSLNSMSITEDDDKWLVLSVQALVKNMNGVHSSKVLENVTNCVELVKGRSWTSAQSRFIQAMAKFTMPILSNYYELLSIVLKKVASQYDDMSHGTFILASILFNIASKGFCSPQPPSEETDDKNLQDGTGLGDGEGAQSNSKDIEQDEDLTENAQEPNKEQDKNKDGDEEEEDSAVEMEGDMAGEIEALSDQEAQDDDEDADSEQEELDEEIDDIGDDDPNAIDEKMWDEKPEDNVPEKQSEKNMDGNADDANVEAADNDESRGDDAKDNENNNEDSNGDDGDAEENEKVEDDDTGDEEGVGEQEDKVQDQDGDAESFEASDTEALELPEDINLESGEEDGSETTDGEDMEKDFDDVEENEDEPDSDDNNDLDTGEHEEKEESEKGIQDMADSDEIDMDEHPELGSEAEADEELEGQEENELKQEDEEQLNEASTDNQSAVPQLEEGIDGLQNLEQTIAEDDVDEQATAQQQSGAQGAGSDAKDSNEQENVGGAGISEETQPDESAAQDTEESREQAKETLKQLGDTLKEYHKRRQEIKEATNRGEENEEDSGKSANQKPDEFEHVDGANTNTDTQALGAADQEQAQAVDEDLAIDEEELGENSKPEDDASPQTVAEKEDANVDMDQEIEDMDLDNGLEDNEKVAGGMIDKRQEASNGELLTNSKLDEVEDEDDLEALMNKVDDEVHALQLDDIPSRSLDDARQLWQQSELRTADLVSKLSEQLRLILEPTLATKLRGDYKTGKRLNMKRIIPYIASQFRKDKIWMRRTKPSKRQYDIMLAVDDSKSMSESNCVNLAFDSLCLVAKTLTQLESGNLSIVKFGETVKEVHQFGQQFGTEAGAKVFQKFGFQESKTDITKLVAESLKIFERGRSLTNNEQWQLQLIISDGLCEDHATLQRLVRRAKESKIMLVFVVIDGINANESIIDMSQVKYVPDQNGNMQLQIDKYLDTFPFEFYVIVRDVNELPEMLSTILRQYFTDLASS